jgi:ATP-dependent Zn protease
LRPGRFDYHIFIPPPDIQGRKDILKLKLEGIQHKLTPEEIEHLAYQTGGFSGADLENLIRETAMISLRENIDNAQVRLIMIKTFAAG